MAKSDKKFTTNIGGIGNLARFNESKDDPNSRRERGGIRDPHTDMWCYDRENPRTANAFKNQLNGRDSDVAHFNSQDRPVAQTTLGQHKYSPEFNSIPQ